MSVKEMARNARRMRARIGVFAVALLAAIAWAVIEFMGSAVPRHIVLASGPESGVYHRYARRYKELLAREGVTVEERVTAGAGENLRLLRDPKSGVDLAFMQGGVASDAQDGDLVMLASLYFEPLWVFYTGDATISRIEDLRGKRIAVGAPGSGTRIFAESLLSMSGVSADNSALAPEGGEDALQGLANGKLDAAIFVGGVRAEYIQQALWSSELKLMSFERADAYVRRVPYIVKLTLPEATIDFAGNIPPRDVTLIGTTAMLVARDGLPPAMVNLLLDTARIVHSGRGVFEAAGEFPSTTPVDFPVSVEAERHLRFGPSFLHRYLPFWVATFIERVIVALLPLVVVLVPLLNLLPQLLRWRVRSRIFRWYGELKLLERDVHARKGTLPIDQWLADLDRIERAAERLKTPASYASEAYTLREHIGLVRRTVLAKAGTATPAPRG